MKAALLKRVCAIAIGSFSLVWMAAAHADTPASVAGTWSATANQFPGPLIIEQGTGAGVCKILSGSIFGNSLEGFYCPATGRIVFARRFIASGGVLVPFQLYEGHLARTGTVDRMSGSFVIWNPGGGRLPNEGVDFNFNATK